MLAFVIWLVFTYSCVPLEKNYSKIKFILYILQGTSKITKFTQKELFELTQSQDLSDMNTKLEFLKRYLLGLDEFIENQTQFTKYKFMDLKVQFKFSVHVLAILGSA